MFSLKNINKLINHFSLFLKKNIFLLLCHLTVRLVKTPKDSSSKGDLSSSGSSGWLIVATPQIWLFQNFGKRWGVQIFPIERGVGKIAGGCFKKGRVSLIFVITLSIFCLSLSVWWVFLFIYTIFISIICVSHEELSLISSKQQIYGFYKCIIFEKKRHCGK